MSVLVERLAKWTAILGGLVLMGLIVLAVVSIVGRSINTVSYLPTVVETMPFFSQLIDGLGIGGVTGDFEMIEVGIAFAIFSFFPYCQLHSGHATVDIFTSILSRRINRYLVIFWDSVLALVILLICWRLYVGMMGKMDAHETSMLLQFPVWWAYALSFVASLVSVVVSLFVLIARLLELMTGHSYMPDSEGAVH
jgi:tripartite ATP-independent transporter DctQ subunit